MATLLKYKDRSTDDSSNSKAHASHIAPNRQPPVINRSMSSQPFPDIEDPATRRIITASLTNDPSLIISRASTALIEKRQSTAYSPSNPFVLDTLVVDANDSVIFFSQATVGPLRQGSSIVLPKDTIIRKFFITTKEYNLPGKLPRNFVDFGSVDSIMQTAEILGLGGYSIQLLDDALARHDFYTDPYMQTWNCRQAVIFGRYWRWTSLQNTHGGAIFLSRLTHLTMWVDETGVVNDHNGLPTWVRTIPLGMMTNLQYLALPITHTLGTMNSMSQRTDMLLLTARQPGTLHHYVTNPRTCPGHYTPIIKKRRIMLEDFLGW
ncbi:hypothetical protein H0H87_002744 [Tephrocybe sp. NHM501043]|nr:hypothetical protein H0H87_002744 [Tephrocybe sp. NHM501043]